MSAKWGRFGAIDVLSLRGNRRSQKGCSTQSARAVTAQTALFAALFKGSSNLVVEAARLIAALAQLTVKVDRCVNSSCGRGNNLAEPSASVASEKPADAKPRLRRKRAE